MLGAIFRGGLAIVAAVWAAALLSLPVSAQSNAIHLGVATCSGGNCHGATERPPGSAVPGNEYVIWSKRDKHRQSYAVLLEERSIKMARAYGLPDAANQKLCLDCHADNVPADRRGRQFQLSDGVGCEACHGGAEGWLGIHISGATHPENIAAGLYPTDQPLARAEKCLSCHVGDGDRFVDHRLYGAGHPRLAFELDTYTAIQPAHFVVDKSYIERKGRVTDLQVWAVGQAEQTVRRMDAILDPKHAPHGLFPEFAVYDCQSCHHPFDAKNGAKPSPPGMAPGTVKLYDATVMMLRLAASRVAPDSAKALADHLQALDRASNDDWPGVQREAAAIRDIARNLAPVFARHEFSRDDMRAYFQGAIGLGTSPSLWQFSHGEQILMALEALVTGMQSSGFIGDGQADSINAVLTEAFTGFVDDQVFRPEVFAKALRNLQPAMAR